MNSTVAIVLVSLLLFKRVSVQSSIFITKFENAVVRLLLADFSAKAKLLGAL